MKAKTLRWSVPKTARKRDPDNSEQFERFVEAGHKAGIDETDEAFERALDKVVQPRKLLQK